MLADLPRKDCWSIAEQAGNATPDGMQHLLAQAMLNAWPCPNGIKLRRDRHQPEVDLR
jgi:hypothetical protein